MTGDGEETNRPRWHRVHLLALVGIGLVFIAVGTGVGYWVTTAGGDITTERTTIETDSGVSLAATVYEPPDVDPADPVPAVVLIHGYTGHQSTMESFASEFADRGYVAITVDQPGHGHSDPPAFADGWGGPTALEFAHSLPTVDADEIALVGHSMGGYASLAAAEANPDGYQSMVLLGSTWGPVSGNEGVPEANETFPRNMAVIFPAYDEFSIHMWDEPIPSSVHETQKMATAFDTTSIEPGERYGSIDDGTARTYEAPETIHTRLHVSSATKEATLRWVGETTAGTSEPEDQSWQWAQRGHTLAMLGILLVAIGGTAIGWRRLSQGRAHTNIGASGGNATPGDRVSSRFAVGLTLLPAVAIYPLYGVGTVVWPVTRLTPQELMHGYLTWGLFTLGAAVFIYSRHAGGSLGALTRHRVPARVRGQPHTGHPWGQALVVGVGTTLALYGLIWALGHMPGSGFSAWMVSLQPLTDVRWFTAIVYGPVIVAAAVAYAVGLDTVLRLQRPWDIVRALALSCAGLCGFLVVQYLPLFLGFGLPLPALGPLAIQAIRTTILVAIATLVAATVTIATDSPLPGGVTAGSLVTWILVSTEPIHVVPF